MIVFLFIYLKILDRFSIGRIIRSKLVLIFLRAPKSLMEAITVLLTSRVILCTKKKKERKKEQIRSTGVYRSILFTGTHHGNWSEWLIARKG